MEFGIGIYTPADAAALLHERTSTIRRWAFGYERVRGNERFVHPPLIRTDLPPLEGERAITFVELVELLYIRAFHRAGVGWKGIREAAGVAARLYASEHPFALRHVYVDPNCLLYGAVHEADGSEAIIQLKGHGQQAFPELVKPFLDQLDFDMHDLAVRWWPRGRRAGVVVDPAYSFGAPIIDGVGIRAKTLADMYDAELPEHGDKTTDYVAWMYEISPRHVDAAVDFQQWLKAA